MNSVIICIVCLILLSAGIECKERKILYKCLNSTTHKQYPTFENHLFNQCGLWSNLSCCSEDVSVRAHLLDSSESKLYNINYEQCPGRSLSYQCKKFFIDDLCFYQCSPYNYPWIIYTSMKVRKERLYNVPLCRSDCNAWFKACQHDYTCSDNWVKNTITNNETQKQCLKDFSCATFTDIFGSATNFCEKVWDNSWKVVDDTVPCMKLRLSTVTHNKLVAYHYAKKLGLFNHSVQMISSIQLVILSSIIHILFIFL